jgi:hypothetical protein
METEKKPFNGVWIGIGLLLLIVLIVLFEIFFMK